jgi:hypothetical protein
VRGWLAGVVVVVCSACFHPLVGPSRTLEDYEKKAASTAKTVVSAVETARLAADIARKDNGFSSYLAVVVGEAESTASGTHSDFDDVQPPSEEADKVRDRLDAILQDVDTTLSEMRITARRGDVSALPQAGAPLQELSQRLADFQQAPRP